MGNPILAMCARILGDFDRQEVSRFTGGASNKQTIKLGAAGYFAKNSSTTHCLAWCFKLQNFLGFLGL